MAARGQVNILATRAGRDVYEAVKKVVPDAEFHELARIVTVRRVQIPPLKGKIAVVSAGTSDLPVAEESAVTAEGLGNTVERMYDVGGPDCKIAGKRQNIK